ncbi:hypothetical protein [Pectobacterium parmentieri]|uniref:hypothetical protein n=1 Tax=Pectobacterium parmentieri TaxID=1905730 RepID=UPI000ACD9D52|nr:hypothetical protein [Pectobacterium parmentieri]PWD56938.1 hypothetical protein DF211_21155 [Pectobacterium parmentieri]
MKKVIIAAFVTLTLVGCSSSGNQSLKSENQESVKTKLIKEKTTKKDVLASFGEPNHHMVIDGEDRWIYTMYNSQMKATSFIPVIGGLFTGGNDTQTKSLIITFKGEKVSSYEFSAGASEIKNGVF